MSQRLRFRSSIAGMTALTVGRHSARQARSRFGIVASATSSRVTLKAAHMKLHRVQRLLFGRLSRLMTNQRSHRVDMNPWAFALLTVFEIQIGRSMSILVCLPSFVLNLQRPTCQ